MAEEAALASLSPLRRYLSPSTFTAAAFALPTISAALIMVGSPGTKELLPLTFVEASVELAADDGLVPAAVVAAAVPPLLLAEVAAAAAPLPSRWSLLGTISNLPSGCREPCLVLLIFILRPFSLSLADDDEGEVEEVALLLLRLPLLLEVKVVVSVNVCVAELELLLLVLVTNVFNLEVVEDDETGIPPPPPIEDIEADEVVTFMGAIEEVLTTVATVVFGLGLALVVLATCVVALPDPAMEVEDEEAAEDMADLSMSASKSMMRFPTSTSGQLSLSSNSKFSDGVAVVFLVFLLGLLRLFGVATAAAVLLLPVGVTLVGTSSCIGRVIRPQHHGAKRYAKAYIKTSHQAQNVNRVKTDLFWSFEMVMKKTLYSKHEDGRKRSTLVRDLAASLVFTIQLPIGAGARTTMAAKRVRGPKMHANCRQGAAIDAPSPAMIV